MIYKNFADLKLSALGLGCMRLPLTADNKIDFAATEELVDYAVKNGINYFDTAWGYHDGESETVIGRLLKKYPRESFYLADKFPGYDLDNMSKVREIFPRQLEKCGVDYFDFYLFHCLDENNIDSYLNPEYAIFDYLVEQKRSGKIRHLGFSAHAKLDTLKCFLDAYSSELEFCQLQINWLDWNYQNAKASIALVRSYGLPVWVMEPVRGGALARLSPEHEKRLTALRPDISTVEWAFRFLQGIDGVTVTLSGMSNLEQLKENIKIYQSEERLSENEISTLFEIAEEKTAKNTLPCTACRYCTEYCPKGLDIPQLMKIYNWHIEVCKEYIPPAAIKKIPENQTPRDCIGCRACEAVCPQNIKISEMMSDFTERLK